MQPKMLMDICKESLGEIKFIEKNGKFQITGSSKWLEFFSGLVDEIKMIDASEKPKAKRTKRRTGLPEVVSESVFDIRTKREGEE